MSAGRHRRDGQRRDALRQAARATWTGLRAFLAWYLAIAEWRALAADIRALNAVFPAFRRVLPRAAAAPALAGRPVQAPRPADPPRWRAARCGPGQPLSAAKAIDSLASDLAAGRLAPQTPGAVYADDGTGTSAGATPSPAAAAPPPRSAAPLPPPVPPRDSPGRGQHPYDERPAWVIFPDDRAAITERGTVRLQGLAWEGKARETGAQAALVRPAYARREAWQDSTARWTA